MHRFSAQHGRLAHEYDEYDEYGYAWAGRQCYDTFAGRLRFSANQPGARAGNYHQRLLAERAGDRLVALASLIVWLRSLRNSCARSGGTRSAGGRRDPGALG